MHPMVRLAKGLEIPTFFLVISLVVSISLYWIFKRAAGFRIPTKAALDASMILMAASLIGSRLMHILYENPEYYADSPSKVFYLWDGGFVFFGGAIAAFLAAVVYFKKTKVKNPGEWFDLFAPVLAFAYGIGRLGCFFAGCCYGKTCDLPWAVAGRHPTQLYALFWELGTLLILLGVEGTAKNKRVFFLRQSGDVFLLWVAFHSAGRLMMESYRDDFRGNELLGLSISSWFSMVLILITIVLFARKRSLYGKN